MIGTRSPRPLPSAPGAQTGLALIGVMALLILVMAGGLLGYLESAQSRARIAQEVHASDVLTRAKASLVGYAVSHPDAPGRLPFPDRNNDGNYDGVSDCVNVGSTVSDSHLLGRFPHQGELGSPSGCGGQPAWWLGEDLRDSAGERLWYAVSPYLLFNGRSHLQVGTARINSGLLDTPSGSPWLTVRDSDGNVLSDRVAAVIIAPGQPLDGQQGRNASAPDPDQYLDEVTVGGTSYSNRDDDLEFIVFPDSDTTPANDDAFNDRLIYITVEDLVERVELRVLGEIAGVLNAYRGTYGRYPWPSPVPASLSTGNYSGVPGRAGYVAYIDTDNAEGATAGDYVFDTGLELTWSDGSDVTTEIETCASGAISGCVSSATIVLIPGVLTVRIDGLTTSALPPVDAGSLSVPMPEVPGAGASCEWTDAGRETAVDCDYSSSGPSPAYGSSLAVCVQILTFSEDCSLIDPAPITRFWEYNLSFIGNPAVAGGTTPSGARTRSVSIGAAMPFVTSLTTPTRIRVRDVATVSLAAPLGLAVDVTFTARRTLEADADDPATMTASGIYYETRRDGVDAGSAALPDWFTDEGWEPYVHVAYADGYLPGQGGACVAPASDPPAPGDCLLLTIQGSDRVRDITALAVSASRPVPGNVPASRVPDASASESTFFEAENAIPANGAFERNQRTATFADQVRIVHRQ